MKYRLLGRSGLRVSELCLGTMTFGEDWGWGASKEESKRIFEAFAAAGGNFIDTSNNYTNGTSEKYVGDLVAEDRDHFVVATKYSLTERRSDPNYGGNHRKNMLRSVEGSLKRLNTSYIDLLYLHMWDDMTPVDEVLQSLNDLVRAGKVLYVGISDTPAWVIAQANTLAELRGWTKLIALQAPYSLAARDLERDIFPVARAFGMSILTWGILEGGELTGKYNLPDTGPRRSEDTSQRTKDLAAVLMQMAEEIGRTPSQVAINWVRQQPANIIPILGVRSERQLKDNLGCLEFELSPDQVNRLNAASPFHPGFPHDFLASDHVRGLIFGETYNQIKK